MRHTRSTALLMTATAVGLTISAAHPTPDMATAESGRLVVFETFNRPG